jgi:hypothetical protein
MKFVAAAGLVLALVLSSCTTVRLSPLARDGVTLRQDRAATVAVLDGEAISLEARAEWGTDVKFVLKVKNKTGQTLHLDGDQFKLYSGDLDRWHEVRIVPSQEVYNQAQKFLVAGTVLLAVGAVALSEPTTVRTRNETTATVVNTGPGSSVVFVQTQRRTYVDEGNTADNLAAVGRFASQNGDRLAELKNNLFYAVDLEAGKSYDGWVFGETGGGSYYKLVIPVGGKDYAVVFQKTQSRGW